MKRIPTCNNMTPAQILEHAKQTLIDKGWCKHAYGRDETGTAINRNDVRKSAIKFCAIGACMRLVSIKDIIKLEYPSQYIKAMDKLEKTSLDLHDMNVAEFNDHRKTKLKDVLGLFDAAIARLRKKRK